MSSQPPVPPSMSSTSRSFLPSATASDVFSQPINQQQQPTTTTGISISSAQISSSRTLDELADEFLMSSSTVTGGIISDSNKNNYNYKSDWFASSDAGPLALPSLTQEELMPTLRELVARRAFADVVRVANRLRNGNDSHYSALYQALVLGKIESTNMALRTHQDDLVYILTVLLQSYIKLKMTQELTDELERWTFLHHNDRTCPVRWIPWSLHIAGAAALQHTTKTNIATTARTTAATTMTATTVDKANKTYDDCLDALWAIRSDIIAASNDRDDALYEVENALSNFLVCAKEWRLALQCLERMMEIVDSNENIQRRVELLSRQGRILLQAGAVDQAAIVFERAKVCAHDANSDDIIKARVLVNDGLLHFSINGHDDATECFQAAAELLRIGGAGGDSEKPETSNRSAALLYSEAINNLALCALYTCRLHEALVLMESLVKQNVTLFLTDRVALNLCTLYELASDSTTSGRKKRVVQLIAKRFSLHDIGAECFRVGA